MTTRLISRRRRIMAFVIALIPTVALAQDPQQTQPPQEEPKTQEDKPKLPAAVGEEAAKPTRGFFSALVHNLGDDVKHMPRMNSVYWLAGGGALALAVHPADKRVNANLKGSSTDWIFIPGKVTGATPTIIGAGLASYAVGRARGMTRVQHLGMDEIEAALLSSGIVEATKRIVRRDRPLNEDGTRQSTFSFPSGHATTTFAAATVLQQHLGYKAGVPTYLVASYVAASRLHDNRHFASDVIFGAATGIVIGRSVTWHGRNFYAGPMLVPGGSGIMIAARRSDERP